jgi:hypothetical protein
MECGAVLENMGMADLFVCSTVQPELEGTATEPTQAKYKGTYNRRAYFSERLSAACLLEPDIPDDDKAKIQEAYNIYSNKNWIQRERRKTGSIHKRDIQQILRSLNKTYKTSRFTTRYLEKW